MSATKKWLFAIVGITNFAIIPIIIERGRRCSLKLKKKFGNSGFAGLSRAGNKPHLPTKIRGKSYLLKMTFNVHTATIADSLVYCRRIYFYSKSTSRPESLPRTTLYFFRNFRIFGSKFSIISLYWISRYFVNNCFSSSSFRERDE